MFIINLLFFFLVPSVLSGVVRHDDFEENQILYKNPGRRSGSFRLRGKKWDKHHLTWFLDNSATSRFKPELIKEHLEAAMDKWAAVSPITFREVDSESAADIVVKITGKHHPPCVQDFDTYALAHGYFPSEDKIGGDIHFDQRKNWIFSEENLSDDEAFDFQTTALHELGHSLGLQHSYVEEAVMYEFPSGLRRELHPDDIAGIQELYGTPITTSTEKSTCEENVFKCKVEGSTIEYVFQGNNEDWANYKIALDACSDALSNGNSGFETDFCNQASKLSGGIVLGCLADGSRFEIVGSKEYKQRKTWYQAWDSCSVVGGRLAHINNFETLQAVKEARKRFHEGTFSMETISTWVGGKAMTMSDDDWMWVRDKDTKTGVPFQATFPNFTQHRRRNQPFQGERPVGLLFFSVYTLEFYVSHFNNTAQSFLCEFSSKI